jgi:hypothetical protein
LDAEDVLEMMKEEFGDNAEISAEEKAKFLAAQIMKHKKKDRLFYRMKAVRDLSSNNKIDITISDSLQKLIKKSKKKSDDEPLDQEQVERTDSEISHRLKLALSENNTKSVVEFSASAYAVLEKEQKCRIVIERYGNLEDDVTFK